MKENLLLRTLEETFPFECTIVGEDALTEVINSVQNEKPLNVHFAKGGNDFDYSTAIDILKTAGEVVKIALPIIAAAIANKDRKELMAEIKRRLPDKASSLTEAQLSTLVDNAEKNLK